nr:Chain A, DNA repair protein RAD2 [Saccharomyces cerevisiae S288C]4Q0W_B Chain B, DNA repair protein RAD2 [Saccharomyces cerevisiae S288C]4Q0Z_A Chain A, Rad2p [Saccharomyces cerevisiae S288C]4Q0Z_B Chain B, Rad2p [Saccharomyces cerevisiae S288C]4Q0Z_E Chain E, Rad2p [Saccharomyces cerevisiae S288C]4Q0Z_F Chain F, Rad2p [Saccharomyces cerevisiae S288C]4Q10_A Chain A, DNA repair protein RAD2 [Saccharomyces cerevisiae S288C]4Q10_B Chain B, DNA repair protein RAD2 [Saccharomyces cerevisiae S2
GVHSFWDIAGPTARPVRLESLEDKRMAVDASIWIYQFLKAVRDQEGNAVKNSHITGFFRRICKLLYFGIRPVFVFDGGVPVLKRETIRQRKERRQGKRESAKSTARKLLANTTLSTSAERNVAENAFVEDELFEQQMKDKRDSDEVTMDMIKEVQELLSRFGIPYITAPMEAEAQCAELLQLNLVDGIITDDSDVFLFGGTKIYKNMFHEKNYVEFYDAESILKLLGLDRKNMIELAQLLGSDYTNGLKGMGPVSSIEVIAEFGNLKNFKDWYNNGQFDKRKQETENKFEKDLRKKLVNNEIILDDDFPSVMVYDAYMRPEVDHDTTPFVWGVPDLDMLRSFMKTQLGWPHEKSDEILIPLIRDV